MSASPTDGGRSWPRSTVALLSRLWSAICLVLLVLLIGVRWLRYSSVSAPIDGLVGELMVLDAQAFLWSWAYSRATTDTVALAVLVLLVSLHRRLTGVAVERRDGVWRSTPIAMALALSGMVWVHYLFDLNPMVGGGCFLTLGLATLVGAPRFATIRRTWIPAVGMVVVAWWVWIAHDAADRLTIGLWAVVLVGTHWLLAARVGRAELAMLQALAIVPMNLLPTVLPMVLPLHAGTRLGDGLAYCFCESPDGRRLYATIPVCDSVHTDYDDCRNGHVVEYDLPRLAPVAEHRFFSPDFYGRLEMVVCTDDEVQVAVQSPVYGGKPERQTVLSFPVASPTRFNPRVATGVGATMAYDREHDAIFYSGEFNDVVARYDRRTRQTATTGEALRRDWFEPVSLKPFTGSLSLHAGSIQPARNRIYVVEWMQGRHAHALDRTTLEVADRYAFGAGGAAGVAVDRDRDRLLVSSLWGLDVFDLASGRLIARKRMGLGNRPVIVDAPRNRLYLSSTVEGKIRILDRDSFEIIGQIPLGVGGRFAHLSGDGRRFFASSAAAHYWWDADTLVSR